MQTYQCFDWILNEYRKEFNASQLAEASGVPNSTISNFRKGKVNPGIEIVDKLRLGIRKLSPQAYLHLHCLMAGDELDIVKLAVMAPLATQGEILKAIGSHGVFSKSADVSKSTAAVM